MLACVRMSASWWKGQLLYGWCTGGYQLIFVHVNTGVCWVMALSKELGEVWSAQHTLQGCLCSQRRRQVPLESSSELEA